jgi:hypothetical protein
LNRRTILKDINELDKSGWARASVFGKAVDYNEGVIEEGVSEIIAFSSN